MPELANEVYYEGAILLVVATAVITYIYRFVEATFGEIDRIVAQWRRGGRV